MKRCTICLLAHPDDYFYRNVQGYLFPYCKPCHNKKSASRLSKEDRQAYNVERTRKHKKMVVDYFGNKCKRCGGIFPQCAYDLHHLDPEIKDVKVSSLMTKKWGAIEQEIKKCVLLCANCHRIIHQTGEELKK